MLGSVRVTGPAFFDLSLKQRDDAAVAAQHIAKTHSPHFISVLPAKVWMSISQMRLVQPITLVGFTALSVESCTNRSTSLAGAHQQIFGAQNIVLDRFGRG